jgi:hypothetical protein
MPSIPWCRAIGVVVQNPQQEDRMHNHEKPVARQRKLHFEDDELWVRACAMALALYISGAAGAPPLSRNPQAIRCPEADPFTQNVQGLDFAVDRR